MRIVKFSRLVAVALLAVVAMSMMGSFSPANAADPRGSIHIHARVCPLELPANAQLFRDCHGHPGPDGAEFRIDNRQPKGIASNGNVSFGGATAGDHLVTLTSDFQPNEFLGMRAFCSNLATGTGPNEATILRGDQAQFWVRVAPGSKLVCDVYFIPVSGQ
jgi:hypothetical protein